MEDRNAFSSRCSVRLREIQLGTGFGFGIFVEGRFRGEVNLNTIHRGARQNAYVGYWVDEEIAGDGLHARGRRGRAAVRLRGPASAPGPDRHRAPQHLASRRVVEKLGLRDEGTALRYLQINGVWEDHIRYAVTSEEWAERGGSLMDAWL